MDAQLRESVRKRADGRCEYCRLRQEHDAFHPFHVEHIVARQHGGKDHRDNLAWACHQCNLHKGPNLSGIDPDTSQMVRLFHPRRDVWEEHFALEDVRIVGRTPIGRTTSWVLQMNAQERLELRKSLRELGELD
jgi:5-methylcytosine-specific restriction endonuclease McrA